MPIIKNSMTDVFVVFVQTNGDSAFELRRRLSRLSLWQLHFHPTSYVSKRDNKDKASY